MENGQNAASGTRMSQSRYCTDIENEKEIGMVHLGSSGPRFANQEEMKRAFLRHVCDCIFERCGYFVWLVAFWH